MRLTKLLFYYIIKAMEQLCVKIGEFEKPVKTCVFTGHRHLRDEFSLSDLKNAVEQCILKGTEIFYNGMAMGFDLLAAEVVLQMKKKYPHVRLIACIPFYGQEKNFPETDKKRYCEILKQADEQILLSEHYFHGCLPRRDLYMVKQADSMIAYCKKTTGGAAYTVKCFQKVCPNGEILYL